MSPSPYGPLHVGGPIGADLGVLDKDSRRMRGKPPFVLTNPESAEGLERAGAFIVGQGAPKLKVAPA